MHPQQTGFAPVNGLGIYYEIYGNGKPLVLIHGGGSTIQTTFGNIIPLLAEKYKLIAVELQSHGHTKDGDQPESFKQDADDVAGLLSYLKIAKASFFGFSNGGHTSMQLAIDHPGLIDKLIIASSFYTREGAFKGFFESMDHATIDNMPGYLKEAYLKIPGNDSAGLQRMFEKDRDRMIDFLGWKDEEISSITAPALIIAGDKDVATNVHTAQMAAKIPNSELMILPGGHGSYMGEAMTGKGDGKMMEFVAEVIKNFLN